MASMKEKGGHIIFSDKAFPLVNTQKIGEKRKKMKESWAWKWGERKSQGLFCFHLFFFFIFEKALRWDALIAKQEVS